MKTHRRVSASDPRWKAATDVSTLGISLAELEEMDAEERREALVDALNRAGDLAMAIVKAFPSELEGARNTVEKAGRELIQVARKL